MEEDPNPIVCFGRYRTPVTYGRNPNPIANIMSLLRLELDPIPALLGECRAVAAAASALSMLGTFFVL